MSEFSEISIYFLKLLNIRTRPYTIKSKIQSINFTMLLKLREYYILRWRSSISQLAPRMELIKMWRVWCRPDKIFTNNHGEKIVHCLFQPKAKSKIGVRSSEVLGSSYVKCIDTQELGNWGNWGQWTGVNSEIKRDPGSRRVPVARVARLLRTAGPS